jgi:hypothetical protein
VSSQLFIYSISFFYNYSFWSLSNCFVSDNVFNVFISFDDGWG